jgi:2-polyprenyl-3-methyl-5-hydroxy-6-metoxy-1,4-benzoquinol methylase
VHGPDEFKAFEAEGWSARASSYDRLMGRVTGRVAEALLDVAGVRSGDRVLDVATGTGAVAAAAVARGASVTGVDISEEMLAVARERVPEARFAQADAEELGLGERFDVLVAGFLINHLPHPERAATTWAGALAPGGRVVLSLWDRPERNRFFGLIGDAIGEVEHDAVPAGPDPYRFAAPGELEELLERAGLAEALARKLRFDQPVEGADQLWEGLLGGSVRSAARVQAQSEAERERARERLHRLAEDECRDGDRLAVPVCVTVGRAVSPARG